MGDSIAPGATAAVGLGSGGGGGGGGGGGDVSSGWGHNGSAPRGGGDDGEAWVIGSGGAWLLAGVLSLIVLTTACGNLLLIGLVLAQRSLRRTSNCFLVSLFLSDLMVALVVMPPAALNALRGSWVLRPAFCPVWLCFDVMCCSASILNLCVISLDRYLLIVSPLRYKQLMTPPRALLLVGGAWGLAALASFLPIEMGWHSLSSRGRGLVPGQGGVGGDGGAELAGPRPPPLAQCRLGVSLPFALVASCLTFFLPSAAICFTYCRILRVARRQARRVAALAHPPHPYHSAGEPSRPPSAGPGAGDYCSRQDAPAPQHAQSAGSSERRLEHRQGRRALKASLTLGVLLGLFFSAWLPFFITNMAQAVCECVPLALFDALTWLGYCNSTMNPIIYPLFMRDFKHALGRLLPCSCCCSSSSASSSSLRSPRRPSPPLSLSLRNSGEPRAPSDPPTPSSGPSRAPAAAAIAPAAAADAVDLLDAEGAESRPPTLLPNQVEALD